MATVVSLTEQKIRELVAGWEDVELTQAQIQSLVAQLLTGQASVEATILNLEETVLPQLRADLEAGSIAVSDLNDNVLPDLETTLAENQAALQDLTTVTIPALEHAVDAGVENMLTSQHTYVQDEPPTSPDDDERELVVGDIWHDSNDGNKQYRWDGAEWVLFAVEANIPNISELVEESLSPEHTIFSTVSWETLPTTNGSNITPAP